MITDITVEGELLERFHSFGLSKNRTLSVIERSLGGATIVINLGSSSVIMRQEEAKYIEVQKVGV